MKSFSVLFYLNPKTQIYKWKERKIFFFAWQLNGLLICAEFIEADRILNVYSDTCSLKEKKKELEGNHNFSGFFSIF